MSPDNPNPTTAQPREQAAWLLWCANEGYINAEDRALMDNWFLTDPKDDSPEDNREGWLSMADELLAVVSSPPEPTNEPGKRLNPEFRAQLVEFAQARIEMVWADAGEVDAATLAQNIVSAQEFAWMTLAYPAPALSSAEATTPQDKPKIIAAVIREHRWKNFGVDSATCECGSVLFVPKGAIFFGPDEAFVMHLANCIAVALHDAWHEHYDRLVDEQVEDLSACLVSVPTEPTCEHGISLGELCQYAVTHANAADVIRETDNTGDDEPSDDDLQAIYMAPSADPIHRHVDALRDVWRAGLLARSSGVADSGDEGCEHDWPMTVRAGDACLLGCGATRAGVTDTTNEPEPKPEFHFEGIHVENPTSWKHAEQLARELTPDGYKFHHVFKTASKAFYRAGYLPVEGVADTVKEENTVGTIGVDTRLLGKDGVINLD